MSWARTHNLVAKWYGGHGRDVNTFVRIDARSCVEPAGRMCDTARPGETSVTVVIRPMAFVDWQLAKALRLRALADAPDAFASTLEEELAMEDAAWQARARSNEEGRETRGFIASHAGTDIGLAVGVRPAHDPDCVEVNALWVAPHARRHGAARALVEAVRDWTCSLGATRLELRVTQTSYAARALYEQLGFHVVANSPVTCGLRRAPAIRMTRAVELLAFGRR
jgi:ribosomal protein S18 acetylase RimI-like enzyme